MTKAKDRAAWLDAWNDEADHLTRAFQCHPRNGDLYRELEQGIDKVKATIAKIADALEAEGVFKT